MSRMSTAFGVSMRPLAHAPFDSAVPREPAADAVHSRARVTARWCVLLLLLAVLPYLNALSADFTLDDEPDIRNNSAVTHGIDLVGALALPMYPGDLYRPFTVLTYAVNETLAPGAAAPFHAVNVLLHGVVTVLVFVFGAQLFGSVRIAWIAAALFAVHPIHTEAVTSLVGRAELLAALFGLLAILTAAPDDGVPRRRLHTALASVAARAISLVAF